MNRAANAALLALFLAFLLAPFLVNPGLVFIAGFAMIQIVFALSWNLLFSYAGYLFGDLPVVQENLKLLIVGIIVVSVLPGVIEVWRHRRQAKQGKQP